MINDLNSNTTKHVLQVIPGGIILIFIEEIETFTFIFSHVFESANSFFSIMTPD
jgi:hypothetical protein